MEGEYKIQSNQKVLFAGLVCVDIVNVMQKFPTEDQGNRCTDCFWQRGGNASNSSTVFSLLGGNVEFFGTLADGTNELVFLNNDFEKFKINIERCIYYPDTACPISIVILSKDSGTRTVLHTNKNLPELNLCNLQTQIDMSTSSIGWIHFEGRDNAEEITKMLEYIIKYNQSHASSDDSYLPVISSLEAEKLRLAPWMEKLNMWQLPDVLFVSKDFAITLGYNDMMTAAKELHKKVKAGAAIICAWGEMGAAAMSAKTGLVSSSSFPPEAVIDTCGAGDTFNAATISALSSGKGLQDAITFGCKIAGYKCGIQGYEGIKDYVQKM